MSAEPRPWWGRLLQWGIVAALFFAVYSMASQAKRLPLVGDEAPDLTLAVAAGGPPDGPAQVTLSDLSDDVVVLDFWASWCTACRRTTPILNDLQGEFEGDPVIFYAVNVEPIDRQRVQAAHLSFGTEFPTPARPWRDRPKAVRRQDAAHGGRGRPRWDGEVGDERSSQQIQPPRGDFRGPRVAPFGRG